MKRTVWAWCLMGFAIVSLLGTLLHFLYDFSGGAAWIAPFSGVNESTWEHMKLLFWPMILFGAIESFFFRDYESFHCVKLRSTLLGLSLIPIIYYTYNGAIGVSPDWVNISIFFISAAAVYLYELRALGGDSVTCKNPKRSVTLLLIIAALFIIFTFKAPHLAIFKDPLTGAYGI